MSRSSFFQRYYARYMGSLANFDKFHNEVINMPRDHFDGTNIEKVRTLSGYLLLTEGDFNGREVNYKQIMEAIKSYLYVGIVPKYRDVTLEDRYFKYINIDVHYEKEGRMFRHLMSFCTFWGLIKSVSRQKKIIDFAKCKEYYLAADELLIPIARNNIILFNINSNDFIDSLSGIRVNKSLANYRPAYGILSYIKQIGRPVTKFELSILLGRIDSLQQERDIINRALAIGRILPTNKTEQQERFFRGMNWKNSDGTLFRYASSQQPDFKFNTFILLLESLGLIAINVVDSTYTLTQYSEDILSDNISFLIADLESLIERIDADQTSVNGELNNLIIAQRNPELLALAKQDEGFIKKMNKRSLEKPRFDDKGKKVRNRLIAELAKIQAEYKCQYANRHIFQLPDGKYYCEAHHILRFSDENGPDITNNLIVLGPEAHMLIHHAVADAVTDAYMTLRLNNVITYERFEEMVKVYHCLDDNQINLLYNKKIITAQERDNLLTCFQQSMA